MEEKKSISSDLSPTDPFVVEELDNGEIILSPLKSRPSPKQRKVTLTGLNEKMKEAQGEISAANRRAQHGFQVLHQVEQQIHALQHFLAEELFQLQDPYSETSQHFSSDEEDLAQDDAHSSSEEQYRYLEKVLTLYDELDAVRQQIDEVCEVSFPEGIQSNIERYRDQDTSNLISSPNDSDEYNEHYEMDAFLHCDGRSIESDVESEKSEGNTVDLVDPVTEDQETLPDNLAILTGDTMEDQEEMELSTTRSFIVRNAMTNQYIHLSESPTNIELMCSTSSLSQIESQPMSSMEPELMASKEFVSYMEELTVEVQPSTERTTNTAVDLPSRVQISLPEVKEDDELIIIASPTFKPDMDHNFYRTTSSPALSTDSKQAYRDPKSMDCGDVYSSFSSDDNDSSEEEGTISSLQVHVPTETASKVDDSFNLTSELEDMEGEDQEEDDHADAYVALTICEVVSELLREVEQRPIVTVDEKQEVDLIRNSVEDVLALVTIQYAEELGKEDGNEANDTEVPGKAAIINSIPFSTAICPTYVPFQALGGDDNEEDDVVPSQTEHDNFISSSIVVLLPSNEGELGEPSTNAEIPPPPVLSPLGALFPDVSVPVRKSLIDALMKSDEETPAVPSIPANQEKPKEEVDEIVEVVTVTENNVEEILKIGEYGVDSGRDSVNSVPSEVVVGDEVISTAESLTPFSADYPEGIRTPLQFSPAPDSPSKINDMEPVHILDSVDDNSMNATPQKSEGRSRTESPSALSLATGSSDSKFRKIMKSLNLDVKRTNSADESSPLKLTDLGDQATTPDGKENSPLNTSRTTLSSHSDLGRSRTPDASMFPNSRPSPPISNFLQNIRQLDSLYQEELEVDHFTKSLEANNKVVSGSGNFTLVSAPITASPRLKSTSPIGRMLESYQSTVDPVSSYQNASTSQIAPKKELNSALHTFLQLVQRCNDTNNRTRDIVNSLDQKLHRQIANPPANTVNSNPRGGAPTIYDVYRQASPKTSSNFAASDRVGKSYSSPERNKILEASKKKAAAVSAFQKSQSSANEKLSKFKNSKSFSISPPKKKPSSDAMSQHSTWGSGRSKY